jgi:lipoyl(octanoyl) transferase
VAAQFSIDLAKSTTLEQGIIVRDFLFDRSVTLDYLSTWQAMQSFTRQRTRETADEIWLLQHEPVYTLGQAADPSHILNAGDVPVVKVDRGGQVTFHGPGQIMCYVLLNLRRYDLGVRALVELLEQTVIELLANYDLTAEGDREAPGVYIEGKKIAALGLRVSKGCSYHGLCFNAEFESSPFLGINPCGYENMEVTQLKNFSHVDLHEVAQQLCAGLISNLLDKKGNIDR